MGFYEIKGYYTLWEFLIDQRFQNKGYGRQALKLGMQYVRDTFGDVDIYTGVGSAYWGFLVRYGLKISPWFGIGAQVTPSFDLKDSFKYCYTTGAIYMNGQITKDGKLFWCSNTWFGLNKDADNTYTSWEYLGYTFKAGKNSITPMVGAIHSWKFDQDVDLAVGAYYSIGKFNIYLWGNDFFKDNPRIVAGIDFAL